MEVVARKSRLKVKLSSLGGVFLVSTMTIDDYIHITYSLSMRFLKMIFLFAMSDMSVLVREDIYVLFPVLTRSRRNLSTCNGHCIVKPLWELLMDGDTRCRRS